MINLRVFRSASLIALIILLVFISSLFTSSSHSSAQVGRTSVLQAAQQSAPTGAIASPAASQALNKLRSETGNQVEAHVSRETGVYSFVRATGSAVLSSDNVISTPKARAFAFLNTYGAMIGMTSAERDRLVNQTGINAAPGSELRVARIFIDRIGNTHIKFDQTYQGLKVFGAQLIVHMNARGITAVNGNFVPEISGSITPSISADAAARQALAMVSKSAPGAKFSVAQTELAIYRTGLLEGYRGKNLLAFGVKISDGVGPLEQVWLSARTGAELIRIPLRHEALNRRVYSPKYDSSNPDLHVVRDENDLIPSPVPQIEGLFQFTGQAYRLFSSAFGRDSFNGLGATMRTVYLVNSVCPNAYWDGASTNYCPEIDGDDVVAHEWGHAYTQFTHDLVYSFQSGALNESYSDIWGETVDLLNGADGDGGTNNNQPGPAGVRWKIGEDVAALGPLRDMWTPPNNDNPDKVSSTFYHCGASDGGGVHTNSGVPNHAYAMLVDGKTFNNVTVEGIGFVKAAHIYYRAMSVYQHSTTNFPHHAQSLLASCNDLALAGTNLNAISTTSATSSPSGQVVTQHDCTQVANAMAAVEMNQRPEQCNFGPLLDPNVPPDCGGSTDVFTEDWETGMNGWTLASAGSFEGWPDFNFVLDSTLPAGRAGTAVFAEGGGGGVCGDPNGDRSGTFSITSPTMTAGTGDTDLQLSFDQFVATEFLVDGGNVLISVNGGAFTLIPQANYTFNAPPSQLRAAPPADQNTNPKAGQYAWSGADPEVPAFGTTKADLSSLVQPGDTFQLRFEFGLDGCGGNQGWYVDNIRVYNCVVLQPPVLSIGAGYTNPDADGTYSLTWVRPTGATGPDTLQEATACGPIFSDNADEPLVSGANSKWSGSPQWVTLANPDTTSPAYYIADGSNQDESLTMVNAVAVPAGANTTLSFRTSQSLEDGFDFGYVEISTNGGSTFSQLTSYTGPAGLDPSAVFNGTRTIDLTPFAGQSVKLRFRITSDAFNIGLPGGWFVEDIQIASENWADLATVSGTSYTLTGKPSGNYCYRVRTAYTFGSEVAQSPFSNVVQTTVENVCTLANVALNALATASSTYVNEGYAASSVTDGEHKGLNWGNNGGWNDGTRDTWPDTLEVAFSAIKTIDEIRVYTVQNDFRNPVEPDANTMADYYGIEDFDVQYWNGTSWVTVPGGSVTGNDRAMRTFTFQAVATTKIRVVVNKSRNNWSRIVEVEAMGCSSP